MLFRSVAKRIVDAIGPSFRRYGLSIVGVEALAMQTAGMEEHWEKVKENHLEVAGERLANERIDNAMADVRRRLGEHLKRMSDRLTTDYIAGEPKNRRFHDSLVDGALELCDLVKALNVVGDRDLESARKGLSDCLLGVTPNELRQNEAVREDTKKAVDAILDKFNF